MGSPKKIQKELRKSVNKDTDSEYLPSNTSDDDDDPYYYYCKARKSRSKLKRKPVLLTKKEKRQPISPDSHGHSPALGDSANPDPDVSESIPASESKQNQEGEDRVGSPKPAADELAHSNTASPCETSDYRFECICGEFDQIGRKPRVQCLKCHLWQHAKCVNYEEKNLKVKPFYCPHCLVAMEPVSTRATLIISPSSICHQWVDEINRHVRSSSLRVLVRHWSLRGIEPCKLCFIMIVFIVVLFHVFYYCLLFYLLGGRVGAEFHIAQTSFKDDIEL